MKVFDVNLIESNAFIKKRRKVKKSRTEREYVSNRVQLQTHF